MSYDLLINKTTQNFIRKASQQLRSRYPQNDLKAKVLQIKLCRKFSHMVAFVTKMKKLFSTILGTNCSDIYSPDVFNILTNQKTYH